MTHLGKIMPHFRLVHRMGKTTGTDIVAAHREGRLTQQDWAQMIHFCRGCEWAEGCADWMAQQHTGVNAPRSCPNRSRFAELRAQQQEG